MSHPKFAHPFQIIIVPPQAGIQHGRIDDRDEKIFVRMTYGGFSSIEQISENLAMTHE